MKNMKKRTAISIVSLSLFILVGCYYDKEDLLYPVTVDCTTVNASYATDVSPLILSKCSYAGCHSAGSSAGGLVLESYTQVSNHAGHINQRCIIEKTMPPSIPLNTNEIAILTCWINAGTPNN
jgi:uncharacterized membrane protein